jgi:hypothetical protein
MVLNQLLLSLHRQSNLMMVKMKVVMKVKMELHPPMAPQQKKSQERMNVKPKYFSKMT